MKKCIICDKEANQTGSHIVPMNLIKECVGNRGNETSFNTDLLTGVQKVYIGNDLKHKKDEINTKNLTENSTNPYVLDYILCHICEKKLGNIEGKVYTEIISKIKHEKFNNNFKKTTINNFEVLIPLKRITTQDLNIYFYSIILRFICLNQVKGIKTTINNTIIKSIKDYLKQKLYDFIYYSEPLKTGLIIYITNKPKLFPTILETNQFDKLIIPCCNFLIILEDKDLITPFGNCTNLISDSEFKLIQNSSILDCYMSIN